MKLLWKIAVLSIITFAAVYGVFYYVNEHVLTSDSVKISSKKVETKVVVQQPPKVYIPPLASEVKMSYDGSFAAYVVGNELDVLDSATGDVKKIQLDHPLAFFYWLPDRNRLLIFKSSEEKYQKQFLLDYFDADRGETNSDNTISFYAARKSMEIRDVKVSTLTNSTFIKTVDSQEKTQIYYMDIMKKMKKLTLKTKNVGNIEAIRHKTHLVYEDTGRGRIYISTVTNSIKIDGVDEESLLGIDNDDHIFVGAVQKGKITKIYTSSLDEDMLKWSSYTLTSPANPEDISISRNGEIIVNDAVNHNILKLKSGQRLYYTGKLIQVIEHGIAINNNGELIIKKD